MMIIPIEQTFESLVKEAKDFAISILDAAGHVIQWNGVAEEIKGYSPDEIIGKHFSCLYSEEDHEDGKAANALKKAEADGRFETENWSYRKDGSRFRAKVVITALHDKEGNLVGFSRVTQDLTNPIQAQAEQDKKWVSEQLRESAERYRAIVEAFDGLIYICSDDYRIEFMNQKFIDRTGKDALGEFCYKVLHDRESVCPWCVNDRVFTGETVRWEVQSPKDGRWYYVVNTPIHNTDGSISKQSMIMDITERKVAEEERKITIEFLSLINSCTETQNLLSAAETFFQQHSGCDVVGIRLGEWDECPYVETRGFPPEVVIDDNELCLTKDVRTVYQDCESLMRSMCRSVIRGRFDSSKPFFTTRGSFWTNSITELLSDRRTQRNTRTRTASKREAYESVALIPLQIGQMRGLLQFHDRRKGLFSGEAIDLWERLSGNLAVALAKYRSEEALREAEEKLRLSHDELEKRVAERTEQLGQTVQALAASEERYALAVQGSSDGIWDLNLVTGETYHSPRCKCILGYEDNEITGNYKEWESRVHPDDYKRVLETDKAYKEGRIPVFEVEYRLRHKDGSYRWVLGRGASLRDSHGKAYRMAGSLTDITERKKLEQQLLQAQKMESIGLLAGGVAHDFNNILTAITGYGELIRDYVPADDEILRESIEQVLLGAERAADLTRSLLAFSRKQVINPKPVIIDNIIADTSKLIRRIIGEDIEFNTCFHRKDLTVMADQGQIEQVLMNLASNARDAMPNGGRLSITTKEVLIKEGYEELYDVPAPGRYVVIYVADTGTGIDKESMERLFEPFYTTKEVGKGTGLGLSIVYGIVKQHGGSILVDSEPPEGTTFKIYLPIIGGSAAKEAKIASVLSTGGKETLLLAEDEEIVKDLVQKTLERAGYNVISAGDGEEAVALFKDHDEISLVLSDVVMPKKNGKQILEEIRRIKPETRVLFISGYTADIIHAKGIFEKDVDLLTKPFARADLLRKVREMLDRQ